MATVLADPTIQGNEPGLGPLRSGGKPGTPTPDNDLPSTRSKSAQRQLYAVQMVRDLWDGTQAIREAAQSYLPQAPGESPPAYSSRLQRSVFFNAYRRTIEGLVGLIFRVDPDLTEDAENPDEIVPEPIREHWENIDLEGTHGDVFCRELEQDAISAGHAGILIDYPRATGQETRAEEQALELRPYWVPIKKENILSWRTEKQGGNRVLTQIVLLEKTMVPDGEFGEKEQTRYRVLYRTEGVVGWRLLEINKEREVVEVIPFVEVRTSGAKSFLDSDPPLLDLAYLNVAHYQQWSDYAYAIHKTNVPFLFLAGVPEARDESGQPVEMVIGPNSYVNSADPGAKAEYISHDGTALGSSKAALDDLKADMGTLGLAMLAPQKRVAETAKAKQLDKSTSDSALSVSARALQDAVENALQFHANYMRLESGGSVTINRDFEGLLMDAPVMSAFAQLVNAGFPARPVLEALQRGGRIPDDADLDELEMEWLMGKELDRQIPPEPGEPEPESEPEPEIEEAA